MRLQWFEYLCLTSEFQVTRPLEAQPGREQGGHLVDREALFHPSEISLYTAFLSSHTLADVLDSE